MPTSRLLILAAFVWALWLPVQPVATAAMEPDPCADPCTQRMNCDAVECQAVADAGCSLLCATSPALLRAATAGEPALVRALAFYVDNAHSGWLTAPEPHPPRATPLA